jgi:uncharacterized protein YxeA
MKILLFTILGIVLIVIAAFFTVFAVQVRKYNKREAVELARRNRFELRG